jgi:hypothetical protein
MEPRVYFVVTIVSPWTLFCMLAVPLAIFELHQKLGDASKHIKLIEGFCCDDVGARQ